MKADVHLVFSGQCDEAFAFYEKVFGTERTFTMRYGDAPMPNPVPYKELVMHTSIPLGGMTLMGCDAPPERQVPMGGFHIAVTDDNAEEVTRIFNALSEGGVVVMPLAETFWSPLFGMCDDKFGVGWMVSRPGQQPG